MHVLMTGSRVESEDVETALHRRRLGRLLEALVGAVAMLALVAAPALAASFKVVPLPPGRFPTGIAAPSDGTLWFADGPKNSIDRVAPDGSVVAYPLPTKFSGPNFPCVGPDGNVWFAESNGNKIGRVTLDGALTEFPVPNASSGPTGITIGPDGNLWFAESYAEQIGRISLDGTVTEFPVGGDVTAVTAGPDGNVWFVETIADKVGRIGVDGQDLTLYALRPHAGVGSGGITGGPDGNVWFTEGTFGRIVKITPDGIMTTYSVHMRDHYVGTIISGPQGKLWFTLPHDSLPGQDALGTITTDGVASRIPLPTDNGHPTGLTLNDTRSALWIANTYGGLVRVTAG